MGNQIMGDQTSRNWGGGEGETKHILYILVPPHLKEAC